MGTHEQCTAFYYHLWMNYVQFTLPMKCHFCRLLLCLRVLFWWCIFQTNVCLLALGICTRGLASFGFIFSGSLSLSNSLVLGSLCVIDNCTEDGNKIKGCTVATHWRFGLLSSKLSWWFNNINCIVSYRGSKTKWSWAVKCSARDRELTEYSNSSE